MTYLLPTYEHDSSSSRSALAFVLLALQHSHIAKEVTYIPISNIYIFAFRHHRLVSYSKTTGLLVRQYFYCCTEYSHVHVQLNYWKKEVSFSMTIGNEELMHECFPKHLRMGTAIMK